MKVRSVLLVPTLLAGLVQAPPEVSAAEARGVQRLYLLAADTGYLYWSADRLDPELDAGRAVRRTGTMSFLPATLFDEHATWSAAKPLRFHLELEVSSATPSTVQLGVQKAAGVSDSDPATETAPGVWEGTLTKGSPLGDGEMSLLRVRVATQGRMTMELRTAGASYVDLPDPVPARAVPELLGRSPVTAEAGYFETPQRALRFNDADWSVASFTADLATERTFEVALERDAAIVYAWFEAFDRPFVHDVLRGRPPDVRKLTDAAQSRLSMDGQNIAYGFSTAAATSVPAGTVRYVVSPFLGSQGVPIRAFVLTVYGPRTLASMRWRFPPYLRTVPAFRTATAAACPTPMERVPVTAEATTFLLDLDWDSDSPLMDRWTLRFDLQGVGDFPCGELGEGDRVRFTKPGERVWTVGPTPSTDALFVSFAETAFEMEVRYSYTDPEDAEPA